MQARERWLALAAGSVVGLWLLDTLVIEPGLGWYRGVQDDTHATVRTVAEARILLDRADRIRSDWRSQHAAGLLDNEDAARFRLQQTLGTSARASGVTLDSVGGGQRIPAPHGANYDTIRFTISGQGTVGGVLGFIAGLDETAQPLRVERCEMSARDGRRDQLDVALTISTRIASSTARTTRHIPNGQHPWIPDFHDPAVDATVVAAKPFLNDRHSDKRAPTSTEAVVASPTGWALVGTVIRPGSVQAFVRDLGAGTERLVGIGEVLADGTIMAIDEAGMHLKLADGQRLVPVGCDLNGQPAAIATAAVRSVASAASSSPAVGMPNGGATILPLTVPIITPDPDRDAILQRLREQRNRSR